jgi:hypothetical protein
MLLPGNLRTTTLGDVLGRLHRQMVSGILELIEEQSAVAGRRHRIHLHHGLITRVESSAEVPPIGEVLVREGAITGAQHRGFLHNLRSHPGRLAGAVLVEAGLVNARVLAEALAAQMRMRVDALYHLHDVSVRFHIGRLALGRSMPASEFLHGRPRARDRRHGSRGTWQRDSRTKRGALDERAQSFAALGLDDGASRDQIRHAFRKLATTVHPDLHPGADERTRASMQSKFAALSAAYHFLILQ